MTVEPATKGVSGPSSAWHSPAPSRVWWSLSDGAEMSAIAPAFPVAFAVPLSRSHCEHPQHVVVAAAAGVRDDGGQHEQAHAHGDGHAPPQSSHPVGHGRRAEAGLKETAAGKGAAVGRTARRVAIRAGQAVSASMENSMPVAGSKAGTLRATSAAERRGPPRWPGGAREGSERLVMTARHRVDHQSIHRRVRA